MLRHNFLLAFRSFKRFKNAFTINLIGLSSGMACSMLIYLWVYDELSVDKFHANKHSIYQVMGNHQVDGGIITGEATPNILSEALKDEYTEVEYAVTAGLFLSGKSTLSVEDNHVKATGLYASKDFFKMFSFDLSAGDKEQVISDKSSIVLSKDLAMKLFKTTENLVGKTVEFQHQTQYLISGIYLNK